MDQNIFDVYVLKSLSRKYHYVGMTKDIDARFDRHDRGWETTTRSFRPFILLFLTEVGTRSKARMVEKFLKSGSGKEFLKRLK